MRFLPFFLLVVCSPVFAAEPDLIGNWKLVAFQAILDNEPPRDVLGADPKGYLILTPEGRMMTLITSSNRKAGPDDPDRAALHKTMFAYSGKYRVEGDTFVTIVDVSWNEAWNGTEQKRHYKFEGDKLLVDTTRQPSVLHPGKMTVGRLVWERDK
jgi:Lipocalin-like domain